MSLTFQYANNEHDQFRISTWKESSIYTALITLKPKVTKRLTKLLFTIFGRIFRDFSTKIDQNYNLVRFRNRLDTQRIIGERSFSGHYTRFLERIETDSFRSSKNKIECTAINLSRKDRKYTIFTRGWI